MGMLSDTLWYSPIGKPYSTGMQAIPLCDAKDTRTFIIDETTPAFIAAKRRARARGESRYIGTHELNPSVANAVFDYCMERLREDEPRIAKKIRALNALDGLDKIAMHVPEDLAIFSWHEDRNWLAYTHVLFPSGWDPSAKLGLDFTKVHKEVPGMDSMAYATGHAIVKRISQQGPYERGNFGLHHTQTLDRHPLRIPKPQTHPWRVVNVERQTTHPFPAENSSLFTIRTILAREDTLGEETRAAIKRSVESMKPSTLKYKGINPNE